MNAPNLRSVAQLALLLLAPGCASAPRGAGFGEVEYPGVLRAPGALPADVFWRQRVTAMWGEGEQYSFDAVVQKLGDSLTVMGLAPAGQMGFALILRADGVEFVDRMPEPLPFPARFMLLDVQRALYPWLPGEPGPRADGEHAAEVDGERVVESWRGGRLMERRFTCLDGEPAGTIRIAYLGGYEIGARPPTFALENGWLGYDLRVETMEERALGVHAASGLDEKRERERAGE